MGITELAAKLKMSTTRAKELYHRFFTIFPGIKNFTTRTIEVTKGRGFVTTLSGRRRYITVDQAPRLAVNSIIQGIHGEYYVNYVWFMD